MSGVDPSVLWVAIALEYTFLMQSGCVGKLHSQLEVWRLVRGLLEDVLVMTWLLSVVHRQ